MSFWDNTISKIKGNFKHASDVLTAAGDIYDSISRAPINKPSKTVTKDYYSDDQELVNPEYSSKYRVNTITSETKLGENAEVWRVADDDNGKAVTPYNVTTFGRNKLDGIKDNDKLVLYDASTKQLYRWDQDTEESAKVKGTRDYYTGLMNNTESDYSTKLEDYEARLVNIQEALQKTGDAATFKAVAQHYDKVESEYQETYKKYIDTTTYLNGERDKYAQKYNKFGIQEMNEDFTKQMNELVVKMDAAEQEYNGGQKRIEMMQDYSNPNYINSFKDVFAKANSDSTNIFNMLSDIPGISNSNANLISDTLATLHGTKYAVDLFNNTVAEPFKLNAEGKMTAGGTAKSLFMNTLNNLGETADLFTGAGFLKANIIPIVEYANRTDMDDMKLSEMLREAGKGMDRYTGDSGEGSVQYDWFEVVDTGNSAIDFVLSFALEIMSDPTNWITKAAKLGVVGGKFSKGFARADLEQAYKLIGATDEAAETLAKRAAKSFYSGTGTLEDAFIKAGSTTTRLNRATDKVYDALHSTSTQSQVRKSVADIIRATETNKESIIEIAKTIPDSVKKYKLVSTLKNTSDAINDMQRYIFDLSTFGASRLPSSLYHVLKSAKNNPAVHSVYVTLLNRIRGKIWDDTGALKVDATDIDMIKRFMEDELDDVFSALEMPAVRTQGAELIGALINDLVHKELSGILSRMKAGTGAQIPDLDEFVVGATKGRYTTAYDYIKALVGSEAMNVVSNEVKQLLRITVNKLGKMSAESNAKIVEMSFELVAGHTQALKNISQEIWDISDMGAVHTDTINDWYASLRQVSSIVSDTTLYELDLMRVGIIDTKLKSVLNNFKMFVDTKVANSSGEYIDVMQDLLALRSQIDDLVLTIKESVTQLKDITDTMRVNAGKSVSFVSAPKNSKNSIVNNAEKNIKSTLQLYVKNNFDADISEEALAKVVVNSFDDIDVTDTTRVYTGMFSKQAGLTQLASNDDIRKAVAVVTDSSTISNAYLNCAMDTLEDSDAKELLRLSMSLRTQSEMFDAIWESDELGSLIKNGVIDAMSGSEALVNEIINGLVVNNKSIEDISTDITDMLVRNSSKYLNSRVGKSSKLFSNVMEDGVHVNFNTPDGTLNVENMLKYSQDKYFRKAYEGLAEQSEQYRDVYFSVTKVTDKGFPAAITFGTLDDVDGVLVPNIKTICNDVAFAVTSRNASDYFGMSVDNALAHWNRMVARDGVVKQEDFTLAVSEHLDMLSRTTGHQTKSMRYVGFNNSINGVGTDFTLGRYYAKSELHAYNKGAFDMADTVRLTNGSSVYTDTDYKTLYGIVEEAVTTATNNNTTGTFNYKSSILGHPTSSQVDILDKYINRIQDGNDIIAKNLSAEVQGGLLSELKALRESFLTSKDAVDKLAGHFDTALIVEDKLLQAIRELGVNCPEHINIMKAFSSGIPLDKGLMFNPMTKINNIRNSAWFSMDKLREIAEDSRAYERATEVMVKLEQRFNKIVNYALVGQYPISSYKSVKNSILGMFNPQQYENHFALQVCNLALKEDLTQVQYYAVLREMVAYLPIEAQSVLVKSIKNSGDENALDLINLVCTYDDAYVSKVAPFYAQPGMSALANRIAEPTSDLMLYNTLTKADDESSKFFANVELELMFRNQFLESNGAFKPEEDISMQIMTKLTSKMQGVMDGWNRTRKSIDKGYLNRLVDESSPMARSGLYDTYSSNVKLFNEKRSAFNNAVRHAEFETVVNMSDEVLEAHIVRNCFNVLLLDPTDAMFSTPRGAKLLADFIDKPSSTVIKTLLEDGTYWMHSGKMPDVTDTVARNDYYFEMNRIARQDMSVNFNVESYLPKYPEYGMKPQKYKLHLETNGAIKSMQDYLPPSFFLSDFTAVTQEYYTALLSRVPGAEFATVSELEKMGWFNDSFACSIIGGQGAALKDAYSYSSQDYLSNIFTGLNHTKKNLEYVQDQFNIYNVKQNSFRYTFDNTMDVSKDNWKMWKEVLEKNDMVLTKPLYLKNKDDLVTPISVKIQEYTITDEKTFREFLDDPKIMVTNNTMLGTLQSYSTGKNRDWKIDRAVNRGTSVLDRTKALGLAIEHFEKQLKGVRMVGWLFTKPATWINNAVAAGISSILQTDDVSFIRMLRGNIEMCNRSRDIFDAIHISDNSVNSVSIHNYFKANPNAGVTEDFFKLYYGVKTHSSGGLSGTIAKIAQDNTWDKIAKQIKKTSGLDVDGEVLSKSLDKQFNSIYKKDKGKADYDYASINAKLSEVIDKAGFDPSLATELKKVALNYVPTAKNLSDIFFKVPVLGAYMQKNVDLFSDVEMYVRTTIAQYYMEEHGLSFSEAMHQSIKSQFDYTNKGRILSAMDTVIPFSTFKVYNTWYWMTEALEQPAALRAIHAYANTYSVDDIQDSSYRMYMTAKYANMTEQDDEDLTPEDFNAYKGAIIDYASGEGYQGTGKLYGAQAGWIPMDDSHSLKLSNGFMEAGNMISNVIMGASSFDNAKSFLQDQIYSPYATAIGTFSSILDGDAAAYFSENVYDAIDFIPFLGTLTNNVIASIRNYNANKADITAMTLTSGLLGNEYAQSLYETSLDMISVAVPSILSTDSSKLSYINRPIGYDWYNQDDEYRSTHKFVLGVSAVPTWVYKDPAHYVDHLGMYLKLGYSKDEGLEMLNKGYIFDEDGNMVKFDRYESDSDLPNLFKYNNEIFDNTLNYLLDRGYSLDESYALICEGGIWVDEKGNKKSNTDLKQLLNESVVADGYKMIPDYIKYEDGQYAKQKAYYKEQGLSIMQAKAIMSTTNIYIDASGSAIPLNEVEVEQRNLAVQVAYEEFTNSLPNYLRYEDGAVSRTIAGVEESFGLTTAQAKQYIIDHGSYVDINGKYHEYSADEVQALNDKNEYDYYIKSAELPGYIRYEAGAISRTRSYLMGYGYSADEAWEAMKNGFYIDPTGEAKDYETQSGSVQYRGKDQIYNFNNTKKTSTKKASKGKTPYMKTGKVAKKFTVPKYSASNYVGPSGVTTNGRTYGMSQVYKHTTQGIGERLKSAYPAAYRNVIYGHKRTLYDDLYLNGIPKKSYILNYRGYANTSLMRTRIKYAQGKL